jgi:hypothetical protein
VARGRRGRRPWGVEQERLHPRDDRGRFARTGGQKWAERVLASHVAAFGDLSAHDPKYAIRTGDGFFNPQGGPRAGRGPGGLIDTKRIRDNADVAKTVRAYQAGETRKQLSEVRNGQQVKVDGVWRDVWSVGSANGVSNVGWQDSHGTMFGKLDENTHPYVEVRDGRDRFEARGTLTADQHRQMEAWRADAQKPPPFTMLTVAESDRLSQQARVAKAQAEYDAAYEKARKAALKKYPMKDGYTRADRARYSKEDAGRETFYDKHQLDYVTQNPYVSYEVSKGEGDQIDTHSWPEMQGDLDRSRPLAVYGDMLHAQDYSQTSHRSLMDLSTIPAEVHAIVAAEAVKTRAKLAARRAKGEDVKGEPGIYVGSTGVTDLDHLDDLREDGKGPRGWHEGATYDEVNGLFRGHTFTIAVGHTYNADQKGHSAAEHELGHALDHAIAARRRALGEHGVDPSGESHSDRWRALHARIVDNAQGRLSPYFRQEGYAGAQELWAEAFAEWSKVYYKIARRNAAGVGSNFDRNPEYVADRVKARFMSRFDITADEIAQDLHEYFLSIAQFAEVHHR